MKTPIETLLQWSEPTKVTTRHGERLVRKCPLTPGHAFWAVWKANKSELMDAGISVSSFGGQWEARWWQAADPAERERERLRREAEQAERNAALEGVPANLTAEQEDRFNAIVGKLLPYQGPSVRRLVKALDTYSGAIDASDTGTGKTYASLAACAVLKRPVFVVCPKAVRPSWLRAARHFGVQISVCNYELLRRGEQPALSLNEAEEYEWNLDPRTVIMFDECHRMKDHKTQNCQMGLAAVNQHYAVLGISATSADNPLQMKFVARVTGLAKSDRDFFGWAKRNGVKKGRWGLEFVGGKAELDSIHQQIFPLHGTRIRIADLGDAFPETQISAECYDTNGNAEKIALAYDMMQEEIARIEASETKDAASMNACILTAMLRARQRAEVLKVPAIAAMAQDAVAEGMSVAIFVNFDDTCDALVNLLKTQCAIRGGQSENVREANIQAFQADQQHIIICNIRAGGVGVSLHGTPTSRMRLAIICPTWSGQDLKQALGRVHRANGAKSVQRIFFAAGTIEERICEQVRDKINRIDLLNDGDLAAGGTRRFVQQQEENAAQQQAATTTKTEVDITIPAPGNAEPKPRTARQEELDRIAERLTPELVALAHAGMKQLAALDPDRAAEENFVGFSAMDGEFGHQLAGCVTLTPRQAAAAALLCRKYRRQLGDAWAPIYELLGGAKATRTSGSTGTGSKAGKLGGFRGHSVTSVIRAMGVAGWTFAQVRIAMEKEGIAVADNTIRIQLKAGRDGQTPAPIDVSTL